MVKTMALAMIAVACFTRVAAAGDSLWLMCEGVTGKNPSHRPVALVASLFEHRGSDGASRAVGVSLITAAAIAEGDAVTKDDGDLEDLTLRSTPSSKARAFTGKAALDASRAGKTTFRLKGTLDTSFGFGDPDPMKIDVVLVCHAPDDAIPPPSDP
jgi:hypothetical protein